MSIFPFISPEVLESSESSELPMFREYAYDFENNACCSAMGTPTWWRATRHCGYGYSRR